jgi:hypothetical protein
MWTMRTSRRPARAIVATLAATLGLLAVIAPAAAVQPQSVTIDSTMYVAGPPPNTGAFTRVSGSNLICSAGSVVDTRYVWAGSRGQGGNPHGVKLQVDKTFSCPTGDVYLRLEIHGVFVNETFTWVVLGGTGDYANLRGHGDGWTDYTPIGQDGTVINHYSGDLH